MALHIVKLPFISRCCGSGNSTLFFLSQYYSPLHGRLVKAHMHSPFRSFAVAKSEKLQIPKKKGWMKYVLKGFSSTVDLSYSHGFYKAKFMRMGKIISKAGTLVSDKAVVEIMAEIQKYVCRGGYKLEAAIEQLGVEVTGKVALDSGLSTGGVTNCLLQYGASYVYGVDVANKIRQDERVCVIERTNLRYLSGLTQKVDLMTLDLSFISILLVMPAVVDAMKEEATLITLVKPQFEARRSQVGSGGIVRDPQIHQEVLEKIIKGVENFGFQSKGRIESPLKGAEDNTEFLVCFSRTSEKSYE